MPKVDHDMTPPSAWAAWPMACGIAAVMLLEGEAGSGVRTATVSTVPSVPVWKTGSAMSTSLVS